MCAKLSHENLRLGLVIIGTLGLTLFGTLLVWLTYANQFTQLSGITTFLSHGYAWPVMACMTLIGFFGGFFSVPLYTWLQIASSEEFRAHAIAANNIINGLFMVAAALFSALVLFLFNSISLLYLAAAVSNLAILYYLVKLEPKMWQDLLSYFHFPRKPQ